MEIPDPWPLRHLVLRTPRLELRPVDEAGAYGLAELAYAGVHPPDYMPFLQPWTDADPRYLGRGVLQYHWRTMAELAPERWTVNFVVRADGRVVGTQSLEAREFAVLREVETGSWLGLAHQGRGYGVEMRAAVLMLAFDHLDARVARSSAFVDNAASLGVSRRLGYREDGTASHVRLGKPTVDVRLLVEPSTLRRPGWELAVEGLPGCRGLLGA